MKLERTALWFGLFVLGMWAGASAAQSSLIVSGVELSDGATDGSDGYYKLGDELMIIAFPDSDALLKLKSLAGKRVTLELRAE